MYTEICPCGRGFLMDTGKSLQGNCEMSFDAVLLL